MLGGALLLLAGVSTEAHGASMRPKLEGFCNTGPLQGCTVDLPGDGGEVEAIVKIAFPGLTLEASTGFGGAGIDLSETFSGDQDFVFDLEGGSDVRGGSVLYHIVSGAPELLAFSVKRGTRTTFFSGQSLEEDTAAGTIRFDLGDYVRGSGDGISSLVIYGRWPAGTPDFAPVPVPAAGWMGFAALCALVAVRRQGAGRT